MISVQNSGKQAPRWFRKFKKIFTNTENTVIAVLLFMGHTESSLLMVCIKLGSSWLLENLETLLKANDDEPFSD